VLSAHAKRRFRLNKYQKLVNLHAKRVKEAEKAIEKSKEAIMRLAFRMSSLYDED
jgi:hypothetical protein